VVVVLALALIALWLWPLLSPSQWELRAFPHYDQHAIHSVRTNSDSHSAFRCIEHLTCSVLLWMLPARLVRKRKPHPCKPGNNMVVACGHLGAMDLPRETVLLALNA